MKRKGFLFQMIGALCIGAFISMPATVNAADRGDVVGEWTSDRGSSVSFLENGLAKDRRNERPYWMQSGSLTVVYESTGATETVDYDLWKGEMIGDIPEDAYADAMIYKIIEPGKMRAQNVYKEKGENQWRSFDQFTMSKKTDTDSTGTESGSSGGKCNHNYEWQITTEPTGTEDGVSSYMCTTCGDIKERQPISADLVIRKELLAAIKNAEAGTTVTFDNKTWRCYPQYVLDALKEKGDVSLKTDFMYEGENYTFTIPAGSDYTNLEQADFYGFLNLFGVFNGVIVE